MTIPLHNPAAIPPAARLLRALRPGEDVTAEDVSTRAHLTIARTRNAFERLEMDGLVERTSGPAVRGSRVAPRYRLT